MAGQDLSDVDAGEQKPTGAPDELMSKKRWQRALISLAGPVVNLIFPLFLLTGYFVIKGNPYPKYMDQPLVILSLPKDSPLTKAGVEPGDRAGLRRDDVILSINGKPIHNWQEMVTAIQEPAGKPIETTVRRKNQTLSFTVTPVSDKNDKGEPAWIIGIRPGQEYSFRKVGFP